MENDETVMRERVGFTLTSCQFKESSFGEKLEE